MARVLGIVGSPRKNGNTHVLVRQILNGARREGAETEELFLSDLEIKECDGCHTCWVGKRCPRKDDMEEVYPKIVESNVLVFGTPVYWYGPTGLMKTFIDRFVYFNCPANRKKIAGKRSVLAVPFEEDSPETASLLVAMFEKCFEYLEVDFAGSFLVPGVTKRGEIRKKKDRMQEALNLGTKLAGRGSE